MRLEGQAAVVTGGGSGLGAATAELLARAGCKVAILDLRPAEELARRIGGIAFGCDVGDEASTQAAFSAAREAHGVARILVNCAGIAPAGRIVGRDGPMPLSNFEQVVRVNLIGTFNALRLAAAGMAGLEPLEDGERGIVINTGSIAAYEGQIGQAGYAASKGGVVALTLQAARELSRFGIRVVTIAPGLFHTPLFDSMPEEVRASLAQSVPFPSRLGDPVEFAALVEHIITNRFLNGETIRLDGALRMAAR
jgi:NAD(P)-dependent dehydrogenase (short-subunit alcohol dehydrogenase family)